MTRDMGRGVRMRRGGGAAAVAVVLLAGCESIPDADIPASGGSGAPAPDGRAASPLDNPDGTRPGLAPVRDAQDRAEAAALIDTVATKGRGPKTGYDRDEYGYAWMDTADGVPLARNGCDTRIISTVRAAMELFSQRTWGVVGCA